MNTVYRLASICVLCALCGCLKKAIPGPDKTPAPSVVTVTPSKNPVTTPVNGNWQWFLTEGLDGPYTPANTHSTLRLEFGADSTLREFKNDTLVFYENFAYVKDHVFFDKTVSDAVEANQTYYRPFIKNDTLTLSLIVMADPSDSKYVRIK